MPKKFNRSYNVEGQKFNNLFIQKVYKEKGFVMATCLCDCGTTKDIRIYPILDGAVISCGCLHSKAFKERVTTHGQSHSPEHTAWTALRDRCKNPNNPRFEHYGGRGIVVDPRWDSFEQFYADMGPRPSNKHSIDRRDNDGPYSPENCYWATREEQARNRQSTKMITFDGQSLCIADWARLSGLRPNVIRHRLLQGWSIKDALTTNGYVLKSSIHFKDFEKSE